MTEGPTTYRAQGCDRTAENVFEALMEYVDAYWSDRQEAEGWDHLGVPVPLMAEVVTIECLDAEDHARVIDTFPACVESAAETEVRGRVISVYRESAHGAGEITILEDEHEGGHTTTARFDQSLGELATRAFQRLVNATVVDMGDGCRLVDAEIEAWPRTSPEISGYLKNAGEPWITVRVMMQERGLESQIDFLIDPAAKFTTLMPSDAERLRLDRSDPPIRYITVSAAGRRPMRAAAVPAVIGFPQQWGEPIRHDVTLMALHPDEQTASEGRPSTMGSDALGDLKLSVTAAEGVRLTRHARSEQ